VNPAISDETELLTDDKGRVQLEMKPGSYEVIVASPGFKTLKRPIVVDGGPAQTFKFDLRVGGCPSPDPCPVVVETPALQTVQISPLQTGNLVRVFNAPDGVSQFAYPSSFELYWNDDEPRAANSYFPVCQHAVVACVLYPSSEFAGTNFQAAAFQERQIDDTATEAACLKLPPDIPQFQLARKDQKRIINGVRFLHGSSGEVGLGNYMGSDLYRAFHKNKCYELSINIATSSFANFEPGTTRKFTRENEQQVRQALMVILDSFRFLK
jgi:hypothetical protein